MSKQNMCKKDSKSSFPKEIKFSSLFTQDEKDELYAALNGQPLSIGLAMKNVTTYFDLATKGKVADRAYVHSFSIYAYLQNEGYSATAIAAARTSLRAVSPPFWSTYWDNVMEDLIWTLGNCHFPMNRYTSEVVCKWKYDEQKKARGFFETGHLGFFWECSKRPLSPDEFKSILDGHFDKLFARELDQCREQKNAQPVARSDQSNAWRSNSQPVFNTFLVFLLRSWTCVGANLSLMLVFNTFLIFLLRSWTWEIAMKSQMPAQRNAQPVSRSDRPNAWHPNSQSAQHNAQQLVAQSARQRQMNEQNQERKHERKNDQDAGKPPSYEEAIYDQDSGQPPSYEQNAVQPPAYENVVNRQSR